MVIVDHGNPKRNSAGLFAKDRLELELQYVMISV